MVEDRKFERDMERERKSMKECGEEDKLDQYGSRFFPEVTFSITCARMNGTELGIDMSSKCGGMEVDY